MEQIEDDVTSILSNCQHLWGLVKTFLSAAFFWHGYGFTVMPILPGTKIPAVKRDAWLEGFGIGKFHKYWSENPDHEVAALIDHSMIVFDADSSESLAALKEIESQFGMTPLLTVKTAKGVHHYYRLAAGTLAKTDSHCSGQHPDRIDTKSATGYMILPPSTGKSVIANMVDHKDKLSVASQGFIDAVFQHNGRPAPSLSRESKSRIGAQAVTGEADLQKLSALLTCIDPDCGYNDWLHVGMAIFHETSGNDAGLALFDSWSCKGSKYKGRREIEHKWRSLRDVTIPVTIGTLIMMSRNTGADLSAIMGNERFEICEYKVITPDAVALDKIIRSKTPLDKYSLLGMSGELEKQVADQVYVLQDIALKGQFTVLYAAPNTGKTLITLYLLIQSIQEGRIDPATVYYVNVDDTHRGLLEKLHLAEEFCFHMLTEGYLDFKASELTENVTSMIEADNARNVIIILDTLKKFTNLMDKPASSRFAAIIRAFVMKGGTVIALAHTNKNRRMDGKLVHAGTSDIPDDADCIYILDTMPPDTGSGLKIIEFTNSKQRGNVALTAYFSYSTERGTSYYDLLLSVQAVDEIQHRQMRQDAELTSDASVIDAIRNCITEGFNTQMMLAKAVAEQANISGKAALKIINKYTGNDPTIHLWQFVVRERGAKVFRLLSRPEIAAPGPASTTP